MQTTLEPASGTPRDAATVVLLRDGASGLEVFLMKRSGLSDAFGEAYVFPGGKLDAHDQSPLHWPRWTRHWPRWCSNWVNRTWTLR